nr:class I tRNA ligase family protein [Candidatus Gracilibacteria bacterium]
MLDKAYQADLYEKEISQKWMDSGVFRPQTGNGRHINVLPPPNANGAMHIGHASGYVIMDIAGRYARMQGKETLLLPGKDHAGILTQTVFEKKLAREEGIMNRNEMSRAVFYQRCYDFCIDSAATMRSQEKAIGLSADWSREKFTLDPVIVPEVLKTFVKMYDEGLAYRGKRIINWCPFCQTAISDIEVEHQEENSKLWELKYPLVDQSGYISVETTRPETMLGDTAVAVHPEDPRFQALIGKKVLLPIMNREIPIIADHEVEREFGSGAVKITPAHDPVDYKMGIKHNLAMIQVIGPDGKMTAEAGRFAGMDSNTARQEVLTELEKLGVLGHIKDHLKPMSRHDRCHNTVEYLLSDQWWINVDHPSFSLK